MEAADDLALGEPPRNLGSAGRGPRGAAQARVGERVLERGGRTAGADLTGDLAQCMGMEGAASVVYLDDAEAQDLWFAMNTDQVPGWVATHPSAALPAAPR